MFLGAVMKKLANVIAIVVLIGTPAFAAPPPAPVLTWSGFYAGSQFGVGWGDEAVNYSPGDPVFAPIVTGTGGLAGEQPIASGYRIPQSGPVGGLEAGYNWQGGPNWVLGFETDFSISRMSGHASGTSFLQAPPAMAFTQTTTAEQKTEWYGTVRGRAGWLATPNLLLFGTGGFAYGKVSDSANYTFDNGGFIFFAFPPPPGFSFLCRGGVTCFAGSSSGIRTGWTAGGGLEWLLDQHWSAKIEYQFVDFGSETVVVTAFATCPTTLAACKVAAVGTAPSFFNATFHDRFNVIRVGLNYRF
jgi:outer membrane immunogenic protein